MNDEIGSDNHETRDTRNKKTQTDPDPNPEPDSIQFPM